MQLAGRDRVHLLGGFIWLTELMFWLVRLCRPAETVLMLSMTASYLLSTASLIPLAASVELVT